MSPSPNASLVRRTIDLKYADRQRAASAKWIFINGALFLIFTLDLWYACPGHTSALHYVEAALACAACASAVRHALRLVAGTAPVPAALSPAQRCLLGLAPASAPPTPIPDLSYRNHVEDERAESLSPPRSWKAEGSPRAPPSPPPPALQHERALRDRFIADQAELDSYLSEVTAEELQWSEASTVMASSPPPPLQPYQVSPLRAEPSLSATPPGGGAPPAPWRRLRLDPARLAHFNLNLRRWLHATVLERLVRELDALDSALGVAGHEARAGAASPARLAALAAAAPAPLARRLRDLLPFLRPFTEQAYVVRRVRELARGPCLAAYRWDGGSAGWEAARCPPDAELVLRLLAAYLDGVVPGGGQSGGGESGAFTAAHTSCAPASPPRGPGVLCIHRASLAPPHYLVAVEHEVVETGRGRDNLLHSVLVFLAAAARRSPPALLRLHLGPAGLNMLWILDR